MDTSLNSLTGSWIGLNASAGWERIEMRGCIQVAIFNQATAQEIKGSRSFPVRSPFVPPAELGRETNARLSKPAWGQLTFLPFGLSSTQLAYLPRIPARVQLTLTSCKISQFPKAFGNFKRLRQNRVKRAFQPRTRHEVGSV